MYKSCSYLYRRKKHNVGYFFCKYKNNKIILDECKNCLNRQIKRNKSINKKSAKKITVSKETYNIVFNRDKTCRLADGNCEGWLELHHVIYRSEDRSLIDEPNNCIMLCTKHHKLVHSNKHYWQPKLLKMLTQ